MCVKTSGGSKGGRGHVPLDWGILKVPGSPVLHMAPVISLSLYSCCSKLYITSPSVSVASRRVTPSERPLRDLCSLVFGATRLKKTTKNIIFEIIMLDYPIWSLE